MAVLPIQLPVLAKQKEDENWRFRTFLKQRCDLDADELDRRVVEITERVWAGIDCTACANCCKTVRPTFADEEVDRLALRLGIERGEFIKAYLEPTESREDHPWQTRTTPCPFLKDNRCSVYEDRPADCRKYPYLHEPDFVFRTMAVIERTFTCPIVYEVLEELKRSVGFRAHDRRPR
jgi:Fe-S-cluster containining protein